MHLKIQKRNGRDYLSVVQSYRQDGRVKTRTVETIGYADAYADDYDDPISHFRAHVADLNARNSAERSPIELDFARDAEIGIEASPPARLGTAIALGCLDAIGVRSFFGPRAGRSGFPEHAGRVFEMLAAERMMHAASKRESWTARDSFPRPCDFSFEEVYAALPCFAREHGHLDTHLANTVRLMRDDGRMDGERMITSGSAKTESGNANAGLPEAQAGNESATQAGSKLDPGPDTSNRAFRINPVESSEPDRAFLICGSYAFPVDGGNERASIAVAIDGESMPLGYHDMSGYLDSHAFRESAEQLKDRTGAKRAVVTAGGLRDLTPTITEMTSAGDGFVLYERGIQDKPQIMKWVSDDSDYAPIGIDVHMKSRLAERELIGGGAVPVQEVVVRGGGYGVRHGHAVLVSSELDMAPTEIIQLFRELWRQAEPFQPLEADFLPIPYPIAARDHIQAHFALCYASFLALRVLRWKMGWKHNAADTADALLRMEGAHLQRNYYLFNYRSNVTDGIEKAVGIPIARQLRTRGELRSVPSVVAKAMKS